MSSPVEDQAAAGSTVMSSPVEDLTAAGSTAVSSPAKGRASLWVESSVARVLDTAFALGLLASAAATSVILGIGVYEMGRALLGYRPHSTQLGTGATASPIVLEGVLGGLELVFLAPLPYLAARSLGDYVLDRQASGESRRSPHGKMLEVKGQISSLIISVLATNAVSSALRERLTIDLASGTALVIGVLCLFFVGVEWLARGERHSE